MAKLIELLGKDADSLLNYRCQGIPKETLHLPGPDMVDRIFLASDRNPRVLANLERLLEHGRLAAPDTCRSCPSIRASNTRPALRSHRTRNTLIRKTSSSWPSKAAATRLHRRSACWASWPASMPIRFPSL